MAADWLILSQRKFRKLVLGPFVHEVHSAGSKNLLLSSTLLQKSPVIQWTSSNSLGLLFLRCKNMRGSLSCPHLAAHQNSLGSELRLLIPRHNSRPMESRYLGKGTLETVTKYLSRHLLPVYLQGPSLNKISLYLQIQIIGSIAPSLTLWSVFWPEFWGGSHKRLR